MCVRSPTLEGKLMITDKLTPHPYAACYPFVSGALEESLLESIKENGLRQPIVLWRDEGRDTTWIIDGRNRHRALEQLQGGVRKEQVIWRSYANDEEVRLAVLDYNENRRQMSTAQKSIVAGKILEARATLLSEVMPEEGLAEATVTSEDGPLSVDEPAGALEPAVDLEPAVKPEPEPPLPRHDAQRCPPKVRKEVAETLGIGARTAQKGATIVSRGAPKLVSALEEGAVSLEAAYTLTQLDDETLEEVIAQGKEGMKEKARELKGVAKEKQDKLRRDSLLGEVEVSSLQLSWVERTEGEERAQQIELTDQDQLYVILSSLKKMGLIGDQADQADQAD